MEFLLDTANLEEIKKYVEILPLAGVTTNPSIIKKEGKIDFFEHMKEIRSIIGKERSLHVQVVSQDYDGMMEDAKAILENIDKDVYVKVPVTEDGLKAMKALKKLNVNITATAIYTKFQANLAIAAGADYIAPYFNRMQNLNIDPVDTISSMVKEIERTNSATKVLAASFKNVSQVNEACDCGAQSATMGVDIIESALAMPSIQKAVTDFATDWESIYGEGSNVASLK